MAKAKKATERVTCSWQTVDMKHLAWVMAKPERITDFFESIECHKDCAKNIKECDSWKCVCGSTSSEGGFYPCNELGHEVEPTATEWPKPLYSCADCGRVILQTTGEVVHRYTRCSTCKADIPEGDLCPKGHPNQI